MTGPTGTTARRVVIFNRPFPGWLLQRDAECWEEWMSLHGIDPHDVLCRLPLVCDDEAYTISWTGVDQVGRGGLPVEAPRRRQGEGPALPFPYIDPEDGTVEEEAT